MQHLRRRLAVLVAVAGLALSAAGPAAAFHCFVVSKPIGAGSIGTVTFDVNTGDEEFEAALNRAGKEKGGGSFLTIRVVDGSTLIAVADVFINNNLTTAHVRSGGTGDPCDGVGIDDFLACLGFEE